jgi:hypothetical protein
MPHPQTIDIGAQIEGWEILAVGAGHKNRTTLKVRCPTCKSVRQATLTELTCSRPTKCRRCAIAAKRVAIRDQETGETYQSMTAAAEAFGVSKSLITLAFKGKGSLKNRLKRLDEAGRVVEAAPEPEPPPPPTEAVVAAFNGRPVMPLRELQSLFGVETISECFGFLKLESRGLVRLLRD